MTRNIFRILFYPYVALHRMWPLHPAWAWVDGAVIVLLVGTISTFWELILDYLPRVAVVASAATFCCFLTLGLYADSAGWAAKHPFLVNIISGTTWSSIALPLSAMIVPYVLANHKNVRLTKYQHRRLQYAINLAHDVEHSWRNLIEDIEVHGVVADGMHGFADFTSRPWADYRGPSRDIADKILGWRAARECERWRKKARSDVRHLVALCEDIAITKDIRMWAEIGIVAPLAVELVDVSTVRELYAVSTWLQSFLNQITILELVGLRARRFESDRLGPWI
jgi:hypothetical protein